LNLKSKSGFACLAVLICLSTVAFAQQPAAPPPAADQPRPAQKPEPANPVLSVRPPPMAARPPSAVTPEGRIKLDVVVTDAEGKPVAGLEPWDFKLLDNGQPRRILSFRGYHDIVRPDPPVEVILLIDIVNLPFQQVAFVRQEVEQFLRENGGHLRQPVSLILLSDAGIRVQPRPSVDGKAQAQVVSQIQGSIRTIDSAMGGEGYLERFQLCVRQLTAIAENEAKKPGRKLLIWVGPGWPMLNRAQDAYSEKDQRRFFDSIAELTNRLRDARIALYSVSPVTGVPAYSIVYQDFLKGVRSARQADAGNLALKVLVTESGGEIMGPDNDLTGQIDRCVAGANVFYRLSFNPPSAEHADEYHDLKLLVDKPGLTVRTNTGYYNEPPGQQE
jgi:VWFA-related protein